MADILKVGTISLDSKRCRRTKCLWSIIDKEYMKAVAKVTGFNLFFVGLANDSYSSMLPGLIEGAYNVSGPTYTPTTHRLRIADAVPVRMIESWVVFLFNSRIVNHSKRSEAEFPWVEVLLFTLPISNYIFSNFLKNRTLYRSYSLSITILLGCLVSVLRFHSKSMALYLGVTKHSLPCNSIETCVAFANDRSSTILAEVGYPYATFLRQSGVQKVQEVPNLAAGLTMLNQKAKAAMAVTNFIGNQIQARFGKHFIRSTFRTNFGIPYQTCLVRKGEVALTKSITDAANWIKEVGIDLAIMHRVTVPYFPHSLLHQVPNKPFSMTQLGFILCASYIPGLIFIVLATYWEGMRSNFRL